MGRDKEENKFDASSFKTADGKHFTGLVVDPDIKIIERFDDRPLSSFPKRNYTFLKATPRMKATVGSMTVPNNDNYVPCCGPTTNQNIGSCYMHAITNQAKWLVWMHTGIQYAPSNQTIDSVYARGVSGGRYTDIKNLWSAKEDDFLKAFRQVAAKCGITEDNAGSGGQYSGYGKNGKENAIKMLNLYGPLWFAHDCGMYYSHTGGHAIIFVGYDEKYAYFQNSWGKAAGNPKVSWTKFVNYENVEYSPFFQTYGTVKGVNVWKDL